MEPLLTLVLAVAGADPADLKNPWGPRRDATEQRLRMLGWVARPALTPLRLSDSPEQRTRVQRLLRGHDTWLCDLATLAREFPPGYEWDHDDAVELRDDEGRRLKLYFALKRFGVLDAYDLDQLASDYAFDGLWLAFNPTIREQVLLTHMTNAAYTIQYMREHGTRPPEPHPFPDYPDGE